MLLHLYTIQFIHLIQNFNTTSSFSSYFNTMNVHGFRDINNQNNRPQYGNNVNQNLSDSIPFLNPPQNDRPPLEETIPYTLKTICCPTLKLVSFSVILSAIMTIVYIFCCFQGLTKNNQNILQINPQVLLDYGALQDILIKRGQVWRIITASFLHMNLLHIVMNLICFVFLLSRLEKNYHPKILAGILLASAVGGNILSVLCNRTMTISAGASGIIFGVIGAYLAFMTINWQTLGQYGQMRSQICCTVGFLVFFSILFSLGSDVDMYGHFGGMIGGYLSSLALLPGIQQKNKKFYMIGASCYGTYILVTFLVFFLTG